MHGPGHHVSNRLDPRDGDVSPAVYLVAHWPGLSGGVLAPAASSRPHGPRGVHGRLCESSTFADSRPRRLPGGLVRAPTGRDRSQASAVPCASTGASVNVPALATAGAWEVDTSSRSEVLALLAILTAGAILRIVPVAVHEWPIEDGGLFYAMVGDILRAGFCCTGCRELSGWSHPIRVSSAGPVHGRRPRASRAVRERTSCGWSPLSRPFSAWLPCISSPEKPRRRGVTPLSPPASMRR